MKKIISFLLLVCTLFLLVSCGGGVTVDENGVNKLSFKTAASYNELKAINGSKVEISGYLASNSPVDGSFIFLMNLPYQSCPFCIPNTTQLSNTMEVYPKSGERFEYTAQAVKVTGRIIVAPSLNELFTDRYGYEFSFKIVDAEYTVLTDDELSADFAFWQRIADNGIVNDVYKMFDYVHFVCNWPEYYQNGYTDMDGNKIPGYYLWPGDALMSIKTEGAQFSYGYASGYFDGLIDAAKSLDAEKLSELIAIIGKSKELAEKGIIALEEEKFSYKEQYIPMFDTTDRVYHLKDSAAFMKEWEQLYSRFSDWMSNWEL